MSQTSAVYDNHFITRLVRARQEWNRLKTNQSYGLNQVAVVKNLTGERILDPAKDQNGRLIAEWGFVNFTFTQPTTCPVIYFRYEFTSADGTPYPYLFALYPEMVRTPSYFRFNDEGLITSVYGYTSITCSTAHSDIIHVKLASYSMQDGVFDYEGKENE